jgi:CBS domain-containing protein
MKTIRVKELMVPFEEYAVVAHDATLHDAVLALEDAQTGVFPKMYKHRAILVVDQDKKVIGKISMYDVLMSLEPKYSSLETDTLMSRHGISVDFLRSLLKDNVLWSEPLKLVCSRAVEIKVSEVMKVPSEDQYIDENATLGEAIHQVLLPKQQSLMVTRGKEVVGVLRLSDIFAQVCEEIKRCEVE